MSEHRLEAVAPPYWSFRRVTVTWSIKPELADPFAEFLGGMFPETRLHKGFRSIRLLRSDVDPDQFVLIEDGTKPKTSMTMLSSAWRPATRRSR
jgi:hypothetical protein